jgi:leucyl-tRNA synthetase
LEWNDDEIAGGSRVLRRVWNLFEKHINTLATVKLKPLSDLVDANAPSKALRLITHTITQKVLFDYERQQFNTVVAAAMELTNAAEKADFAAMGEHGDAVLSEVCYTLVKILAPVTPHLSEHLWSVYGTDESLDESGWLVLDETALVKDEITYVVQVNGKLRAKLDVAASASKDEIEALALADENVQRFLADITVRKVIVVPNKLVNIVAN